MAEKVVLTTPEPASTEYTLRSIYMELGDPLEEVRYSRITIAYVSDTGKAVLVEYYGAGARQKIIALGKANFTTVNLWRRINETVIADGKMPGAPAGSLT